MLGGSIAGLLAARVLAEVYQRVTVVERDELPADRTTHRPGVPHGRHVHGLLARGREAMEELLPGLTAELVAQDAPTGDMLGNARWFLGGRRMPRTPSGLLAVCASRPLIEGTIRDRVRALPNVSIMDGCDIVGIVSSPDQAWITGVRVVNRRGPLAVPVSAGSRGARSARSSCVAMVLDADLVVDATGRGSRTPSWLTTLGYRRPVEERVEIGMGYATRLYEVSPGAFGADAVVVNGRYPGQVRGGVLQAVEGGRCLLSLAGMAGDHPGLEPVAFDAYAKSLPFPDTYEIISSARPLTDPVPFRFPASLRRRYERLDRFPAGLLVTGDAVCSFNPVYGQGMSVAALEALALRRELARGGEPRWRRYFAAVARQVDAPWAMTSGGDLAILGVVPRGRKARMLGRYMARLQAAAADDPVLARAFIRVAGLAERPQSLLRPDRVVRVLRHGRRNARKTALEPHPTMA